MAELASATHGKSCGSIPTFSFTSTESGDSRRLRAEHHDDFRMLLVDSLKESFRMSTGLYAFRGYKSLMYRKLEREGTSKKEDQRGRETPSSRIDLHFHVPREWC